MLNMWDDPTMKLTPDAKRRVVLPLPIQKGDVLLLDEQGHNQWLLTRLERPRRPPKKFSGKSVSEALSGSAGADLDIVEFKRDRVQKVKL